MEIPIEMMGKWIEAKYVIGVIIVLLKEDGNAQVGLQHFKEIGVEKFVEMGLTMERNFYKFYHY